MNGSFINAEDLNDFVEANKKNNDSSIFKYNDDKVQQNDFGLKKDIEIKEVPFRWIILISFCFLNFSNGMQWVTFSAIAENFGKYMEISDFKVDLFSLLYMIVYPFVNFPCSYIIDSKSMRSGLVISAILTIIGSILKIFTHKSLFVAYLGQALSGIAQPFILNSPGKLSTTWFRPDIRILITSVAALFNTIGVIFGFILPSALFEDKYNKDNFSNSLSKYLIIESAISFVLCAPCIILMRNKPPFPPSLSEKNHKKVSFGTSIKILTKNKNFLFLLFSFTFIIGYTNLYGTKINSIFAKYNKIGENEISIIVGISNIFGIIGAIIISIFVDKLKKYKKTFLILAFTGLIFQTLITVFAEVIDSSSFYFATLLICLSVVQFCVIPIFTISFDLVIELTYPVGESISGGIIMTMTQISGIISIFLVDYIVSNNKDNTNLYIPNVICTGMLLMAFIPLFFISEKLLRLNKDLKIDSIQKLNDEETNS